MTQAWDDPRIADLTDAIRRQTEVGERIAQTLARLEVLTALENERREADRREQSQDRAEARMRFRQLDGQLGPLGRGTSLMNLSTFLMIAVLAMTLYTLLRH